MPVYIARVLVVTLSPLRLISKMILQISHLFFLVSLLPTLIHSHGLLTDPPQRGTLNPSNKFNRNGLWPSAPIDNKAHFPAGDKDAEPGAALRSQIAAVPFWTPFQPIRPDFQWRAGVCGDLLQPYQQHMRGIHGQKNGLFYYHAQNTRNYTQASVIEIEINIIAHHNGFIELHMCDVDKCGGEISEQCFKKGLCHHLIRAPNPSCDSGYDRACAPIDSHYPHRWYLPCTVVRENVQQRFGRQKMTYLLPENLTCQHCVLHWFWTAANTCNPPGVVQFFEGPHRPKNWGQCFGQGGARGGYTKVQKDCGPDRFPEEYYQCADVRILSKGKGSPAPSPSNNPHVLVTMPGVSPSPRPSITPSVTPSRTPTVTPSPTPSSTPTRTPAPTPTPSRTSTATPTVTPSNSPALNASMGPRSAPVFVDFYLVADGQTIRSLPDHIVVDISPYRQISIEAVTTRVVSKMKFFIDNQIVWREYVRPYYLFGNKGTVPFYWTSPIVNHYFTLRAAADGHTLQSTIMLRKR